MSIIKKLKILGFKEGEDENTYYYTKSNVTYCIVIIGENFKSISVNFDSFKRNSFDNIVVGKNFNFDKVVEYINSFDDFHKKWFS